MVSPHLPMPLTPKGPNVCVAPVVLVVDDEQAFCRVMAEVLRRIGFAVHQAYRVSDAASLLRLVKPDLILADVVMPEVDGLTFIREVRSKAAFSEVPIIVVSARVRSEDVAAAMEAGADAFLSKPFSISELRSAVCSFLEAPATPTRVPIHSRV